MKEIVKEYKSWLIENQNFILKLRSNDSALYTRILPIYEVLNYFKDEFEEDNLEINGDIIKIFQVGFEYLHNQIFTCKLYLENNFNNNVDKLLEYDKVIGYLLYVEDLRYEFKEKNIKVDEEVLKELIEYLENIMIKKINIPDNLNLYVDALVHKLTKTTIDFHNIIDIFVEIAETLDIDLYFSTEEFIIGKEI